EKKPTYKGPAGNGGAFFVLGLLRPALTTGGRQWTTTTGTTGTTTEHSAIDSISFISRKTRPAWCSGILEGRSCIGCSRTTSTNKCVVPDSTRCVRPSC